MSKNVAVFVDVANIFYAAKAAGVDIDYVTLLKSATAGRDFVRAYAYTGLDPDNENQRQFQAFLARNGFKVVTKDIRKYGDGKVKANLDIELVVDLMKTARNLDVAVVVSGDGDFAPAIRAVQETGVRVEVISFRGNTSSDLMDVADLFTDITQIAKVERGSVRSGRRVAASDDLSMTEVPDKETEGATQRRRRTRGASRDVVREDAREVPRAVRGGRRPAARSTAGVEEPAASLGSLVVLPGEKLRRAVGAADVAVADEAAAIAAAVDDTSGEAVEAGGSPGFEGDEQGAVDGSGRRRRRRGGRGRGRGRGGEAPELPERPSEEAIEDEEEIAELVAPLPARPTFGSVWDSQLGMPTAASAATASASADDLEEDLEEPAIPEYLLAERSRRGAGRGRQPRVRGGRASTYQQALDRERYGRSTMNAPAAPAPRRDRGPAVRVVRPGGGDRVDRDRVDRDRQRPPRDTVGPSRPPGGGDPWSEVPPEIEELLRAEMSKQGARDAVPGGPAGVRAPGSQAGAPAGEAVAASRGRGRGGRGRGRGREAAGPAGDAGVVTPAGARSAGDETPPSPMAAAAAAKPAARTRRSAAGPRPSTGGAQPGGVEAAAPAGPDPAPASPPRPPRKPRASKTGAAATAAGAAAGTDVGPGAGQSATAGGAPAKRAPRRRKAEPEG